ncbi:hypothetical protein [Catenulispora subtropica]|uniref:Uncharacterized protein n=1 Tax=Catenulispora subtropica TaxID=450798 RepID=A0ABP5DXZ9_9ACTN
MAVAQEFAEELIARVGHARVRLARAADTADLPGIAAALDELESAYDAARQSGVVIPRAGSQREEANS